MSPIEIDGGLVSKISKNYFTDYSGIGFEPVEQQSINSVGPYVILVDLKGLPSVNRNRIRNI